MTTKQRATILLSVLKELYPSLPSFLNYTKPYELLFAVIMSAQTTDKQVNKVTEKLFKKYKKLEDYANASTDDLESDIKSIGFFRSKAKHIVATAKILVENYQGKVPSSMSDLLTLPGVARKTANVVLGKLYGRAEGIAVDTHVIRLSRQYGLTKKSDPKKIEKDLMKLIPQKDWIEFTNRMIQYGRDFCPARKRNHENCPITKALLR